MNPSKRTRAFTDAELLNTSRVLSFDERVRLQRLRSERKTPGLTYCPHCGREVRKARP